LTVVIIVILILSQAGGQAQDHSHQDDAHRASHRAPQALSGLSCGFSHDFRRYLLCKLILPSSCGILNEEFFAEAKQTQANFRINFSASKLMYKRDGRSLTNSFLSKLHFFLILSLIGKKLASEMFN
jgi:hypothetical protein